MDTIIEMLTKIDMPHLLVMAAMLWIFNKHLDKRFDKIEERFDKIEQRLERIENQAIDIDKRVFAIETMLHMKDCCMLKDNQMKKVE